MSTCIHPQRGGGSSQTDTEQSVLFNFALLQNYLTTEIFRLYFSSEAQYILTTSMQDLAKCQHCSLAGLSFHMERLVHYSFYAVKFY